MAHVLWCRIRTLSYFRVTCKFSYSFSYLFASHAMCNFHFDVPKVAIILVDRDPANSWYWEIINKFEVLIFFLFHQLTYPKNL